MKIQQLNKLFKKNESGRSMVEMLGVLAVIGVLSVGGVYGYRMAMEKMNLNRFQNFLGFLSLALQDIYMKEKEDQFIVNSTTNEAYEHNRQVLLTTGFIPEDYKKQLEFLKNHELNLYVNPYYVTQYGVPTKNFSLKKDYLEGCRNLLSLKYPEHVHIQQVAGPIWYADTDDSAEAREAFCQEAVATYNKNPGYYWYMQIRNLENIPD